MLLRFYVYALLLDNEVFYIGKGSGRRTEVHLLHARRGHDCYKCRKIRKGVSQGQEYKSCILFECETEAQAFDYERALITLYHEQLTNLTLGGEGLSGYRHTDEAKERMRQLKIGQSLDEAHRRKLSDALKGKPKSAEHNRKMTELKRGRVYSEETRQKLRDAIKGKKRGPYKWKEKL